MRKCNCSKKQCNCLNEHLNRMKYLSGYALKEAKYNLIQSMDEDDTIPEEFWSTKPVSDSNVQEDEGDVQKPQDNTQGVKNNKQTPETPEMPAMPEDQIAAGQEPTAVSEPTVPQSQPEESPIQPTKSTDELQNDIIKTSIAAMQKMHNEMDKLNMSIEAINSKIDGLTKDVNAVKEPTNVEKLTSRKNDSHPFYFNLNDMWNDNWFQARRTVENSNGIIQLEDGTYVADFDTLPKYTDKEIKDSFNV